MSTTFSSVSRQKQRTTGKEKEEGSELINHRSENYEDMKPLELTEEKREISQASVSRRTQRTIQNETEEGELTEGELERSQASVSRRKARTIQKEKDEGEFLQSMSTTFSSVSRRKQRTTRREKEGSELINHRSENYEDMNPLELTEEEREISQASVSKRKQRTIQKETEEGELLQSMSTTFSSVSRRKQRTTRREKEEGSELINQRSENYEDMNPLELTEEEREISQASVSRRKQRTIQNETEEGDYLQSITTSSSSVSRRKQRTIQKETEEGQLLKSLSTTSFCKPMSKATPDQVEPFQTKGSHCNHAEIKTHSTKSMPSTSFHDPHKGLVLVIVNYSFPVNPLQRGNDIEEISTLFPKYGYQVKSFTDLNKEDILSKVKSFSKQKNIGSFVCFLSSHGNQTSLACPDGGTVRINDILCAADTKQLMKKPKVFFIDACRSNLNQEMKESDNPEPPSSDYFVGFSCLASKRCLVGKKSCGIYFQALIEVFKDGFWRPHSEASKTRDINHFMEKVNYRVSEQKDEEGNNYQMPIYRSTLTGKLFLQGRNVVSEGGRIGMSELDTDDMVDTLRIRNFYTK